MARLIPAVLALCLLATGAMAEVQERMEWIEPQRVVHLPHLPNTNLSVMEGISHNDWKKYRFIKRDEKGIIIDVQIENDPYGFRSVPTPVTKKKRENHVVFAGCSMAFGQGVTNDKTTISVLTAQNPDMQGYNFGFPGGSVGENLYLWRQYDFRNYITQEKGIFIYNLIFDHFERTAMTWRYLYWANYASPVWKYDAGTSQISFEGLVGDTAALGWSRYVNDVGLTTEWLRLVNQWDNYTVRNSYDKFLAMLFALKREYERQFPQGKFVVARIVSVSMFSHILKDREQDFFAALKAGGIEVWDSTEHFKQLKGLEEWTLMIPRDGHPNEEGNKLNAEYLAPLIRQKLATK